MGIPIISEIWDGIRWIIDFFVSKVPAPIKFLIFLLFLLIFGSLISLFLHLSGVHCNSDKDVVKVSITDIGTNIAIMFEDSKRIFTESNLSICDVHPDRCGSEHDCYFFARELDNGLFVECNITNSSSDCGYYLKDGQCHNCTEQEICFQESMNWIFCGDWHSVCVDNAYPSDYSTAYDTFMGCGSACFVPEHYIWNFTSGQYECKDLDYCGVGATKEQTSIIDEKLLRAGAELIYPSGEAGRDYKGVVYLKCNADFNPRLTFFGIDLFDYKIWLFLVIIYILVILLFKLNRQGV